MLILSYLIQYLIENIVENAGNDLRTKMLKIGGGGGGEGGKGNQCFA